MEEIRTALIVMNMAIWMLILFMFFRIMKLQRKLNNMSFDMISNLQIRCNELHRRLINHERFLTMRMGYKISFKDDE